MNKIIFYYISKKFLLNFLYILFVVSFIVFISKFVNVLDNISHSANSSLYYVNMALNKTPYTVMQIIPYGVFGAALWTITSLNKNNELVALRAAGFSVWRFLLPIITTAFLIGSLNITVFSPIASNLYQSDTETRINDDVYTSEFLHFLNSGFWLRQIEIDKYFLLNGQKIDISKKKIQKIKIFHFDKKGHFIERWDANYGYIYENEWLLYDVRKSRPSGEFENSEKEHFPTPYSLERMREQLQMLKMISFWALPKFIQQIKEAGFQTTKFELQYYKMYTEPVLFSILSILGAIFGLSRPRKVKAILPFIFGSIVVFLVMMFVKFFDIQTISSLFPIYIGVWLPNLIILFTALPILIHLEDG